MNNYKFSEDKSLYDIFNMTNPNCYQALIIENIIDKNITEAISNCTELLVAIEYYKWDTSDKNTPYIDSLICQSDLEKWQKTSIMYTLGSNIRDCIKYLESVLQINNVLPEDTLNKSSYRDYCLQSSISRMTADKSPYKFFRRVYNVW